MWLPSFENWLLLVGIIEKFLCTPIKKNCQGWKEKEVCDFTMISTKKFVVKKSQACKRKKVSNITSYQTAYQRKNTTIHPKRHRKQSHDQKDYVLL